MTLRFLAVLVAFSLAATAQTWRGNHEESKVQPYTLPDPLTLSNGKKVSSAGEWLKARRPEILRLFETEVYGRTPATRVKARFDLASIERKALDGKAVRKQITISFPEYASSPKIHVLLYLPAAVKGPAPVFLGLNFPGNHTVHADPGITLPEVWSRAKDRPGFERQPASESSRGRGASHSGRWKRSCPAVTDSRPPTITTSSLTSSAASTTASARCCCSPAKAPPAMTSGARSARGRGD